MTGCQWCGNPAVANLVVEPEVYASVGGVKVLVKRATLALACGQHKHLAPEALGDLALLSGALYPKGATKTPRRTGKRKPGSDQMTVDDLVGPHSCATALAAHPDFDKAAGTPAIFACSCRKVYTYRGRDGWVPS